MLMIFSAKSESWLACVRYVASPIMCPQSATASASPAVVLVEDHAVSACCTECYANDKWLRYHYKWCAHTVPHTSCADAQ